MITTSTHHSTREALAHRVIAFALLPLLAFCAPPTVSPNAITGTVVERVDGTPYTFLRLETRSGQVWVAVPMAQIPKESKVTVKNGAVLRNFESKQAGRKFEAVVFGVLEKK